MEHIFHRQGITIIIQNKNNSVTIIIHGNIHWYKRIIIRTSAIESAKLYNMIYSGFAHDIDISYSIMNDLPIVLLTMVANNAHIRFHLNQQHQPYNEQPNQSMQIIYNKHNDPIRYINDMIEQLKFGFVVDVTSGGHINLQVSNKYYIGCTISDMFKQINVQKIFVVDVSYNKLYIVQSCENIYKHYSYDKLSSILLSLNTVSTVVNVMFWIYDNFLIVSQNTLNLIKTLQNIHL